ncbi:MAG: hypothetical protein RDV41_10190 [Planctomycetota bacterium]|nr:hypothetical protein [Planctomycetota bacterium]
MQTRSMLLWFIRNLLVFVLLPVSSRLGMAGWTDGFYGGTDSRPVDHKTTEEYPEGVAPTQELDCACSPCPFKLIPEINLRYWWVYDDDAWTKLLWAGDDCYFFSNAFDFANALLEEDAYSPGGTWTFQGNYECKCKWTGALHGCGSYVSWIRVVYKFESTFLGVVNLEKSSETGLKAGAGIEYDKKGKAFFCPKAEICTSTTNKRSTQVGFKWVRVDDESPTSRQGTCECGPQGHTCVAHNPPSSGGAGGPGGGPAAPLDPPDGSGPTAAKQPDRPASPLTTFVAPQTGMVLAEVRVTPGKTLRLFDPEVGGKAAAEVRVTEDDDGKVLPFIVGGVALASAGLFIDSGGSGGKHGPTTGSSGPAGPSGDTIARTLANGDTSVTEGLFALDTQDTLTITPDGSTPPLTIQNEKVEGWTDTAIETRKADGNTVWNYPTKKLAEVVDDNGLAGQTVQYQLSPDEIEAGEHAFVLVDKNGVEMARKSVGGARSTQMSIVVVPQDGPPGSPATLEIAATGIMDYYERSVWGGMPEGTTIAIDYSLSGGATGPTSASIAEVLSLPIKRGASDGQISAQLVSPEEK